MYQPLATPRQVAYLQHLTDRAVYLKMRHPSLVPNGIFPIIWESMTSEKAQLRIRFYQSILDRADLILHPSPKVAETEDLPA